MAGLQEIFGRKRGHLLALRSFRLLQFRLAVELWVFGLIKLILGWVVFVCSKKFYFTKNHL